MGPHDLFPRVRLVLEHRGHCYWGHRGHREQRASQGRKARESGWSPQSPCRALGHQVEVWGLYPLNYGMTGMLLKPRENCKICPEAHRQQANSSGLSEQQLHTRVCQAQRLQKQISRYPDSNVLQYLSVYETTDMTRQKTPSLRPAQGYAEDTLGSGWC